jgi:hypothetical protein
MDNTTRMIKIEENADLFAAAERCRANRPKVRREAINKVIVINQKGKEYTVTFAQPTADLMLATCNCMAGINGVACYHIPAAMACPAWQAQADQMMPGSFDKLETKAEERRRREAERESAVLVKPRYTGNYDFYGAIAI